MIFNTIAYYFLFLIPAAILFRLCKGEWRSWICVFFGVGFFVYFSVTQLGGWWGAACIGIFIWESAFRALYKPGSWLCFVGVFVSLAVLVAFKYWNFLTGLATSMLEENLLRWDSAFLPLGVSFFTFEFIHYAVDRYNDKVERGTIAEYLAFIFFFPTMVAGPIKKFQDFVPYLRKPSTDWASDWNRGLTRILTGLVKKFAVADLLTSLSDHLNQSDIVQADRWVLILWLFAYGWKIYFDFSAYSDIAIGSGRLFGVSIPENFDWPYTRTNIVDFWRHWHMSLYKWLLDYIFIPLGGSRGSIALAFRNIIIVMLVSGIWHGAGLNFIVWGLWHGCLLIVHRLWTIYQQDKILAPGIAQKLFGWLLTYVSVNIGWAFFAMDLNTALLFYRRILMG